MIRTYTLVFFFMGFTLLAFGQGQVSGLVLDTDTGNPLEYATISLLQKGDSSLVTGGLTDTNGNFNIEVNPGNYMLRIQYVSFETETISDVQIGEEPKNLGEISLKPSTSTLSEVVVAGKKEQTILELDKRIFNVSEDLSNTGRNAADILDNLPSVTVDVEGSVSLRGSSNVRILVDGKPSGLIGIGDTGGLQNLSGDMIERVEVVTNPSARYDAEGSAGIINIVLKKQKKSGLNGSFTANAGHPTELGGAVNLNYRQKWMNLFVNYGVRYRNRPGNGKGYQLFTLPDTTYITRRSQERTRGGLSNNIRVGTDFIFNEFNTLTASFNYRISDGTNTSEILYRDFTLDNDFLQRTLRTDNEEEDEENQEYELFYKRTFEQKGRELSATAQYRKSDEIEASDIVESAGIETLTPSLLQRSNNNEHEEQWLIQADYVHPVSDQGKFETGYRGTLRQIDNKYLVEEQNETGIWQPLAEFNNSFEYDENIHAAYAIYGSKAGKWSYMGGLRMEATDITTNLIETSERNDKNYINFFPSAFLTYTYTQGKSIQGSYSRRINRPNFWSLNPFFSFSDARNIRSGNPDLDPEFTDSYELGYLQNFTKGNIYLGGYYRHTTGVIQNISRVEDDGITYNLPENLSTQNSFGLEFNTLVDLLSWWKINGNLNIYRAITKGEAYGLVLQSDAYTLSSRLTSKWNIPNIFDVQLSGFFRAPEKTPQGRRKAFYGVDLGATRDILKNKATLALNVRDLLNSRKFRGETFGEYFYQEDEFRWGVRQVTVSFTYRLNQLKGRQRDEGFKEGDQGGEGEF